MDVIMQFLPIIVAVSLFVLIAYAAKRYKDGRKSTVMGTVLALLGAFSIVAQFVGSKPLEFHNSDAFILSLVQIAPGLIMILIAWKLLKGKRTNS